MTVLGPQVEQVPAGGRTTVVFPWVVEATEAGSVQLVATVTPGQGTTRRCARPVEVKQPVRIHRKLGRGL